MQSNKINQLARRSFLGMFSGIAVASAAPVYAGVSGYLKGAGNIRTLYMYCKVSGEELNAIYWTDGHYISPVLKEVNYFMRDWREGRSININHHLLDIIYATHTRLRTSKPFILLSGYRTRRTNNMLRKRRRGISKKSYHIKGKATDLRLKNRSIKTIIKAAKASQVGGVGAYYRSGFIHLDSGPRRDWVG